MGKKHKRVPVCKCGNEDVRRSERHDALYCPVCAEWLEKTCNDPDCEFCPGRPEQPDYLKYKVEFADWLDDKPPNLIFKVFEGADPEDVIREECSKVEFGVAPLLLKPIESKDDGSPYTHSMATCKEVTYPIAGPWGTKIPITRSTPVVWYFRIVLIS